MILTFTRYKNQKILYFMRVCKKLSDFFINLNLTNMNQAQTSTLLTDTHFQGEKHQQMLDFELKQLLLYGPALGIYAFPRLDSQTTWNGVIIVRHGCYKGAKFKIQVNFRRFPQQAPTFVFLTKPYHPLINSQTGDLDVGSILTSDWDQNNPANLYQLMNNIQTIFVDRDILRFSGSYNPKAGLMFEENQRQFMLKALQSVEQSLDFFEENESGWSLQFGEVQGNQIEDLKQQVFRLSSSEGSIQQKIKNLMSSLMSD